MARYRYFPWRHAMAQSASAQHLPRQEFWPETDPDLQRGQSLLAQLTRPVEMRKALGAHGRAQAGKSRCGCGHPMGNKNQQKHGNPKISQRIFLQQLNKNFKEALRVSKCVDLFCKGYRFSLGVFPFPCISKCSLVLAATRCQF